MALPPGLFCELPPDEVHVTAGVVERRGLLDGLALDWNVLQLQQGDDAVGSLDLIFGFLGISLVLGISLGLDRSIPSRNLLLVDGLLPESCFFGLLLFHSWFFARVLLDADTINGGRTQGILAQHVWHAGVAGQHPLDGVAVAVP